MSAYQADPNDNTKQIPKSIPTKAFSQATVPAAEVISDRPSYILINVNGTYAFAYESGSVGTYITGSVVGTADQGPVRLDISPVAWRKTDAAGTVGDVTFVFRGGR